MRAIARIARRASVFSIGLYAALAAAFFQLAPTAAAQCAMCKEALNPTRSTFSLLSNGMFWSILFMLGVPFTMFALIVTMIIRSARRPPPLP